MAIVPATPENLRLAAAALRAGELVCFPTETVYGVGGNASDPEAVAKVFRAKGRPADHPLIVHLPSLELIERWADDVSDEAQQLARQFWPGPLTLVLHKAQGVPYEVTGGQDTVALRVPGHPLALELLREFGGGLAAPSANRFSRISTTRAEHAEDELGDRVAMVLDGGPTEIGLESTILDLSGSRPRILRPGAISRGQLTRVLGRDLGDQQGGEAPRVPGRLPLHYAPGNPVRLVRVDELEGETGNDPAPSVLAISEPPDRYGGHWLTLPADPEEFGRRLYAALRELDALDRPILIEAPPRTDAWEAVNDRLDRATGAADTTQRERGR